MEEEFELTYLAKELPADVFHSTSKEIVDMYVPASEGHPTLRIRKSGDRYEITKKQPTVGNDSSHFFENTIPLTAEEYADLIHAPSKDVAKTRYYYNDGKHDYEVDVFNGALEGLVMVDVEFKDAEARDAFVKPDWCGADVTQEKFAAGGMVCGKSYDDIASILENFGYTKITT